MKYLNSCYIVRHTKSTISENRRAKQL